MRHQPVSQCPLFCDKEPKLANRRLANVVSKLGKTALRSPVAVVSPSVEWHQMFSV